jgi:hypothetical protein
LLSKTLSGHALGNLAIYAGVKVTGLGQVSFIKALKIKDEATGFVGHQPMGV